MMAVSPKAASVVLGCTERSIWRLLEKGTLQRAPGSPVRVTEASIDLYLACKKTTDILLTRQLNCQKNPSFNEAVSRILKLVPALSEPQAAAKRLGIPAKTFERLIDEGSVPVLEIGSTKFVPGGWLAEKLAEAYELPTERKTT